MELCSPKDDGLLNTQATRDLDQVACLLNGERISGMADR